MIDATVDMVRALIPDTEAVFPSNDDPTELTTMFSDADIQTYLLLGQGNAFFAAGLAMIAVGNSESLIEKVITTQDLSTDGSKLQAQWLAAGKQYIALGNSQIQDGLDNYFQIIDFPAWGTHHELAEN